MKQVLFFMVVSMLVAIDLVGQTFVRVTEVEIATDVANSSGVAWGDYDGNGYLDLFVANTESDNNFLYKALGDGLFSKVEQGDIVNDMSVAQSGCWGDYDNDGDLDLFVTFLDPNNQLYRNEGNGTFTRIITGDIVNDGGGSRDAAWADYDNDGYLDLFVVNRFGANNFLYRNNGDGTFTKILEGPVVTDGGDGNGASWGDFDNDGHVDLFVANTSLENNFLYRNNGDGTFSKVTEGPIVSDGGSSQGGSWADYDNDGYPDLFVANSVSPNNFLYRNNRDGTFTKISDDVVVTDSGTSSGSAWADMDNDGDLDLFVVNRDNQKNFLYSNNGDGSFTKVTEGDIVNDQSISISTAWADYDNDGDLDAFVANFGSGANYLYSNNGNSNNWINIKVIGFVSNTSAIGTKIRVKAQIGGQAVWQMREVSARTGLRGQNSLNAEFGLGDATVIDTIKIEWPSGTIQDMTNVSPNQFLTIQEPQSSAPRITSVRDVNFDQGGFVTVEWAASSMDKDVATLPFYSIWRALPLSLQTQDSNFLSFLDTQKAFHELMSSKIGAPGDSLAWEWLANQPTLRLSNYSYTAKTLFDSLSTTDGLHWFMVVAHTNDPNVFSLSEPVQGYSADNLAPESPRDLKSTFAAAVVTLHWEANTEVDLNHYLVFRSLSESVDLSEQQPLARTQEPTFVDGSPPDSAVVYYSIVAEDIHENRSEPSLVAVSINVTSVDDVSNPVVRHFSLEQNYPNPFNPSTTISFGVPKRTFVVISLHDVRGRQVKQILAQDLSPGPYQIVLDAHDLASGAYFIQMRAGDFVQTRKLLLVR